MVLLVEEQELLIDSKSDVLLARILEASQGMLHDRSSEFASGRPVINPPGVLPILQQEFAVTDLAAGVGLGTEACTTCVALGLVAPSSACLSSSSTLAFAHLDRVEVIERAVENLSATLDDPTAAGTLDTYIVGGYVGCTGQEMSVMHSLVRALSKSKRAFRIQLCCTGALNTDEQGLPRARSLAIHSRAETGPYPQQVRFEGKEGRGVEFTLRSCRPFCTMDAPITCVFDFRWPKPGIKVQPFQFFHPEQAKMMLSLSDTQLLHALSTSPEAEDERFVPDCRAALALLASAAVAIPPSNNS